MTKVNGKSRISARSTKRSHKKRKEKKEKALDKVSHAKQKMPRTLEKNSKNKAWTSLSLAATTTSSPVGPPASTATSLFQSNHHHHHDDTQASAATTTTRNDIDNLPSRRFSFQVNVLDHCESPRIAYEHIQHLLNELHPIHDHLRSHAASDNDDDNKQKAKRIRIWDPYYCDGSVKRHLEKLGFLHVHHQKEDFYAIVEKQTMPIPPHDIFLTNPPYSENHIERLLNYLSTRINPQTPFCLLLPNWVARKKDFKNLLPLHHQKLFYLSPIKPYSYVMPSWNRGEEERPDHVPPNGTTTPYLSSWYIYAGNDAIKNNKLMEKMNQMASNNQSDPASQQQEWVVAKTIKGLKWKIQKLRK